MEALQIILSSVTAIAAIVAPLITTLLNNKSQREQKKLELYQSATMTQLSNLTTAYGNWRQMPDELERIQALTAASHELALYTKDKHILGELLDLGKRVSNAKISYDDHGVPGGKDIERIEMQYLALLQLLAEANHVGN